MKQIVQNYRTGKLTVEEVPAPLCRPGGVLVRTAYSLVSTGTERMKTSQARMGLVEKARARPDKVRQVLNNARQFGVTETVRKVSERLDALTPLGYSLSGIVEEVGAGIDELAVGDRVVCAGEGVACHAEFVYVPRNLCAAVPPRVKLDAAAFATVGAIAIHGVRQASVTLGDTVLVIGLGLVGLLAVQILKAAGCRVVGIDLDADRVKLAARCGADLALTRHDETLNETIATLTSGHGIDAAYIAASTESADPMQLAGELLRDRGRVVIVGMVPIEADWRSYYAKEISVVLSRSYGPGRYDRNYEQRGIDYPVGYVRWTQRRNLEEFVRLLAAGAIHPMRLAPAVFKLTEAPNAYQKLQESASELNGGILFRYADDAVLAKRAVSSRLVATSSPPADTVGIGMIGAGNFATGTLIPALKRLNDVRLRAICSAGGLTARSAARRHGFDYSSSDVDELLADDEIQAVVIATRHDTHASMAARALQAGKHVFVEKPLALTATELDELVRAQRESGMILMPGFNRRFSPLSVELRDFFARRSGPIEALCRVNAGPISADSWYQDPQEGGWRIISEGCHFVDLLQFICRCSPVKVYAQMIAGRIPGRQNDNCSAMLTMADGSVCTLLYVANGDPSIAKERIEAFGQGRTAFIDNWRYAQLAHDGKSRKVRCPQGGKGHREQMAAFIGAVRGQWPVPITLHDAVTCTQTTLAIRASMLSQLPEPLRMDEGEQVAPAEGRPTQR